jgi:hypothetical protein
VGAEAIVVENSQPNSEARIGVLELRRGEVCVLEAMQAHEVARALGKKTDPIDAVVKELEQLQDLGSVEPEGVSARLDLIVKSLKARQQQSLATNTADPAFSSVEDGLKEVRERLSAVFEGQDANRESAIWTWVKPQVSAILESESERTLSSVSRGLRRIVVARCGDAWGCFERCEALLAGQSHSALWWSRRRALQLLTLSLTPSALA